MGELSRRAYPNSPHHGQDEVVTPESVDVIQHQAPTPGTSGSPLVHCGKVVPVNNAGTVKLVLVPNRQGEIEVKRRAAAANNFGVHARFLTEMISLCREQSVQGFDIPPPFQPIPQVEPEPTPEAVDQDIRQVEVRQLRLARLYIEGSIPGVILSSQSEELNNRRMALESNRRSRLESAPQAIDIKQLKERLPEAAARLRQCVFESSEAGMELILRGLSVRVVASHEEVHIEGTAPIMLPEGEDLVTIVQTRTYWRIKDTP